MGKATKPKKPAKTPAPAAKAKTADNSKSPLAPSITGELLTVPVSALSYNSKINARGDDLTDIDQLAATIQKEGLIQPIAVRPAGKKFEPLEGGRRFRAIEHLVRSKAPGWTADTLIPVISRKLTDAQALEASIAAHVTRLDLTPAQEAVAFRDLQKLGKSVEEIAATYAMPERFVRQRLAIGNLPATILKALKAGEINAKTAEAFTLTDDVAQQVKLFTTLAKRKDLNEISVRQQLTGKATPANHAHARFVGETDYVTAGGTVTADLFGDDRWLEDGKLLGRLFDQKVKDRVKLLQADGWSFVTVARDHWHDYNNWPRLTGKGEQAPEAKHRIAELDQEIGRVKARIDELNEVLDRLSWDAGEQVEQERDKLDDEILPSLMGERASIPTVTFTADQKAKAGVVIRIAVNKIEIMYGMVDPAVARAEEKAKEKKKKERARKATASAGSVAGHAGGGSTPEEADFTGALKSDLAQHLGGALQMAIAAKPQAAQYLLIATLVMDALRSDGKAFNIHAQAYFSAIAKGTKAFNEGLAMMLQPFRPEAVEGKRPPDIRLEDVLTKLELFEHGQLMEIQAALVARALSIGQSFMERPDIQTVVNRVDPQVGKWWTPDKEFFGRLKKPDLIEALGEAAVANIPKSGSKGQLVELAVEKLPVTGWLPKPLRAPSYAGPGSNAWANAQGERVADGVAGAAAALANEHPEYEHVPGTSILRPKRSAAAAADASDERKCRKCGCGENHACVKVVKKGKAPVPCHWVEADLCSHCAEAPAQQAAE